MQVIERLYTFLSSFKHRWEVLSSHLKVMMTGLVTTCWNARYEAIRAVKTRFPRVIQAFDSLISASENLQTREDAQIILLSVQKFSFMSHFFYWEEIMGQINLIQKKLQEPGIGLDVYVTHMDVTKIFFNRNKDGVVSESVYQSKTKCEEMEIPVEKRKLLEEKEDDVCQTFVQDVKINLYKCQDQLVNELETRFGSMSQLQTLYWIIVESNPGRY